MLLLKKGAVVGGGSDVTDDLITKMGKASDDQIKEVEMRLKPKSNKMLSKMHSKQIKLQQVQLKLHNN